MLNLRLYSRPAEIGISEGTARNIYTLTKLLVTPMQTKLYNNDDGTITIIILLIAQIY